MVAYVLLCTWPRLCLNMLGEPCQTSESFKVLIKLCAASKKGKEDILKDNSNCNNECMRLYVCEYAHADVLQCVCRSQENYPWESGNESRTLHSKHRLIPLSYTIVCAECFNGSFNYSSRTTSGRIIPILQLKRLRLESLSSPRAIPFQLVVEELES